MPQDDPIAALIDGYHELNPTAIDELEECPSSLEFMRYVAKNRPFVVRRGAHDWNALKLWNAKYLKESMKGRDVNVAVTPKGNADAVVQDQQGRLYFVEPYEISEPFAEFLTYVRDDMALPDPGRHVKYAQTQNGNLPEEYSPLAKDIPTDISFATDALEKRPDAVNFWLGNKRSTTSLHKDNYENIYVQVRGQKHFTLLAPIESPCANETPLPFGRYRPASNDPQKLEAQINTEIEPTPVPIWDPDLAEENATLYSQHSRPLKVTLDEGDLMYLPALWYHKVAQSNGAEGFACSVNYWYDLDFAGGFWTVNQFIRDAYHERGKRVAYPELRMAP